MIAQSHTQEKKKPSFKQCNKCPEKQIPSICFAALVKRRAKSTAEGEGSTEIPIGSFQWVALNRHYPH